MGNKIKVETVAPSPADRSWAYQDSELVKGVSCGLNEYDIMYKTNSNWFI